MVTEQKAGTAPDSCVLGWYTVELGRRNGAGSTPPAPHVPSAPGRARGRVIRLDDYRPAPPPRQPGLLGRAMAWLAVHI